MDVSAHISISSESGYFDGHFPGKPILPGVVQIALVQDSLEEAIGEDVSLRGIVFTRLRQVVLPGETLDLTTKKSEGDRLRFDLKRDGALVTNGEFLLGPLLVPGDSKHPDLGGGEVIADVPSIDNLLPHRPPMCFIQKILAETPDSIICMANIPSECALVKEGYVPAVAGVEAAAQAAAAWETLQRQSTGGKAGPRVGYLVALRDVTFFVERIPADTSLVVSVGLEAAAPPLSHYRIEIFLDDKLLLSGTIATFLSQDEL